MIGRGAGEIGAKENKSSDFHLWRLATLLDLYMKQQHIMLSNVQGSLKLLLKYSQCHISFRLKRPKQMDPDRSTSSPLISRVLLSSWTGSCMDQTTTL